MRGSNVALVLLALVHTCLCTCNVTYTTGTDIVSGLNVFFLWEISSSVFSCRVDTPDCTPNRNVAPRFVTVRTHSTANSPQHTTLSLYHMVYINICVCVRRNANVATRKQNQPSSHPHSLVRSRDVPLGTLSPRRPRRRLLCCWRLSCVWYRH